VFQVGLSIADTMGRVELVNVAVPGDPQISIGQLVRPVDMIGFPWEQQIGGRLRWGIAYRATQIVSATPAAVPTLAPSAAPSADANVA
jgi:hypothetical protein